MRKMTFFHRNILKAPYALKNCPKNLYAVLKLLTGKYLKKHHVAHKALTERHLVMVHLTHH